MQYHIVLNRPTDLVGTTAKAADGQNPRHSMAELQIALNAKIHDGANLSPGIVDKVLGKVTRIRPIWWTIARKLRREVAPGDVIFCTGEDVGTPVAALCGGLRDVHVTMMVHSVDSAKKRLALRLFSMDRKVSTFMAVAEPQIKFLQQFLKLPGERAQFVWDQTDTRFFSPGPQSVDKSRPVIMSVGLEQRDYGTLATATADLDLDVHISGFSADTRVMSRAFPAEIPANMSRKFYPWPELQQLYRDADIVVVSLFPSQYAAGVQALMEALACARPVIVTGTEGLNAYLDHRDCVRVVPPGDPVQMRKAITELLNDPAARISMGQKALALAHERHPLEQYIHRIVATLKELAANTGR